MFVAKKSTYDFIVFTHVDMKVVTVDFDSEYCEQSLIPKLKLFYENYFMKYVVAQLWMSCVPLQGDGDMLWSHPLFEVQ